MIDLSSLKLTDLIPPSIMGSEDIIAIANALDKELQAITACINEIIILPRIDELPEDIVDHLAGQLHVDYYEPLGLDLEKKRALVKSSLSWHRRKGTKSVLEEVIRILFLDDFSIQEWFEYGGEPYFFRLVIEDPDITREKFDDIIRAVYELKNVRSWLEALRLQRESKGTIYFGTVARHTHRFQIGGAAPPGPYFEPGTIHLGTVAKQVKRFTIPAHIRKTEIQDGQIYVGQAIKHVSKFYIRASQEVKSENGNL